jgi:Amt family ammonium transporter
VVYGVIKVTMGIRLTDEEQWQGADLTIHRITAEPDYNRGEV